MLNWTRLHPTKVIALGVVFVCVAFVVEREVTQQASAVPLGWIAVLLASAVSFCCGASFQKAQREPPREQLPD